MKATRDGFGDQLLESGKNNDKVIVLGADLGKATKTSAFQKEFPDRFYEIGIAECNMIGIASGLSEYGFRPVISSFASFLTGKYDVIRVSVAYSNAPVILVGTHSGLAIGKDGVTQMGLEDITLMRALPNMTVIQPSTYNETKAIVKHLLENEMCGPVYLRLGRQPVEEIFHEDIVFTPEKANVVKSGDDVCICSTGCVLPDVISAARMLEKDNISCEVVNFPTIKPLDTDYIKNNVHRFDLVVTVEDHSIVGGFGSSIAEALCDIDPTPLCRIGLNDTFPESGDPRDLYKKYGLDDVSIYNSILGKIRDENK